jgi:asparagine synthase (glutamine-hydrolysing)
MFAFVIYDKIENRFFAARDQLGIKPLFYSAANGQTTFGSEPAVLRDIVGGGVSDIAIAEWKAFRRPLAGRTFFDRVSELKPGHYYDSKRGEHPYWMPTEEDVGGDYEEFKEELVRSVTSHLINDFQTVSLLSGGLDSAVILGLSDIEKSYTVGLEGNNEFEGATDSAGVLGVDLVKVQITQDELEASWAELLSSRREPLSVPNEGLIYTVCKSMNAEEKVVLTGEGADELLFGYDRIFRWGSGLQSLSVAEFVNRYTYSSYDALSLDTLDYLADCMRDKKPIEFLEDFFIGVHLPGLLRRMDGASMCASKEARVPFVTTKLFNMLYREPIEKRHIDGLPKSYLRRLAKELGLEGALSRAKVGFSATVGQVSKADEYTRFQNFCLDNLGWR